MSIKAILLLLVVFSSSLVFAKTAVTTSDKVAAKNIYAQIKATYMVAAHYYENNSFSYSGVTLSNLCVLKNIPGVCGSNPSRYGFSKNSTYFVTSGAGGAKVIISLDRVSSTIGRILEAQFRNDSFCTAQYNSGILKATCKPAGKNNNLAICDKACSEATNDKTGRAFVICLQNPACIAAGITASTDDTDYASSNLGSISNVGSYTNLSAGVTIFGYVNSCHSVIKAYVLGGSDDDLICSPILADDGSYPTSNCGSMGLSQGYNSAAETDLRWLNNCKAAFHHWCGWWNGRCYIEQA